MRILRTLPDPARRALSGVPGFYCREGRCYADCADGRVLRVLDFELEGAPMNAEAFTARFGSDIPLPLGDR
jgi:methionyl-tRNA formyltransferase